MSSDADMMTWAVDHQSGGEHPSQNAAYHCPVGCAAHQLPWKHGERVSAGWGLNFVDLPSGKHTKNYGKSPFLMGKSTINGHFQ